MYKTGKSWTPLGAVIDGSGIVAFEHVKSREDMVKRSISQMKSWRTLGLSAGIIFRKLFSAKMLPCFSYAFSLLNLPIWGPTHTLIRGVFDKALANICGWIIPSGVKINPGLWTVICGVTPVSSFLRQEKLLMAARLWVGDFKAARIFRGLFKCGGGSFERDVKKALIDWSLKKAWDEISKENVLKFKKKVKRIAKKQWPRGLGRDGQLTWLYHNHRCHAGNMPMLADWIWPEGKSMVRFKSHFVFLVTGLNPAGGNKSVSAHPLCKLDSPDSVYHHHFFECVDYDSNSSFFRDYAHQLF